MVGVWIDPVTAQVMMTLLMARGLPLVLDARPTGGCRWFYPPATGLDKRRGPGGVETTLGWASGRSVARSGTCRGPQRKT